MAYDSVRAQLDKLLGVDRNGPLTESAINEPPNYRDAKFCKHYLLGFCPNDLYIKQRSEPGSCRLEHSETAKSSFEKDEAEGRVREDEKLRWMRALLSECRTIVAEEDRKIRGQARRLQESYGCGGELSGLMIRNFDTLKKLGMVSQNAKIRVLSEIDENEPLSDDDTTMLHTSRDHSADANVDNLTKPEPTNNSDLPNEVQSNSLKGAESEEINNPGSDIKKDAGEEDEGENDDDLDGFGLIKVIPAGDTPEDPATNENVKEKGSSRSATDTKPTVTPTLDNPIGTEKSQMANKSKQPEAESNAENCTLDCTGEKIVSLASDEGNVNVQTMSNNGKEIVMKNHETTEESKGDGKKNSNGENSETKTEKHTQLSVINLNAGEKKEENNLMDKFYEIGVGPDGLQMLDRKQSKRVCACCGGYISLVDAESRLLSHFGGKSHHSLAQLRAKIPEVEAVLAKGPRIPFETSYNRYGRYGDREYGRFRNNEDWRSRRDHRGGNRGSRYDDRYRDSHSSIPQHYSQGRKSGGEGNSNARDAYDNRYGSRYRNDDYDNDRSSGRHDRYHGRRKRHRSPSPHRGSRRRRRHY